VSLSHIIGYLAAFASHKIKVEHLIDFYKNALVDPNWTLKGVGEGDERLLLEEFFKCQKVYSKLNPQSQRIIADINQRMATGMAEFVDKDMGQGTVDVSQYNRYCHFVAGLVGEGLSRLFAASGLEKATFASELHLSDQMGLFLQKVNIIRDYLEDYVDGRAWWPQSIWKKYSISGDLGYFVNQDDAEVRKQSLACLNELVTDALELAPDCLAYMSKLQCAEIFRFCAIPQVMAIATLDKLYANPDIFTGVVKIRKGLSCKLILQTSTVAELHSIFHKFSSSIASKARKEREKGVVDPSYDRTIKACDAVVELTEHTRLRRSKPSLVAAFIGIVVLFQLVKYVSPELLESTGVQRAAHHILRGIALALMSFVFLTNVNPKSSLQTAAALTKKKL
jgi:farnesyl-diphosphate farnesyltransferase